MKRKTFKSIKIVSLFLFIIVAGSSISFAQNNSTSIVIRSDIFAATTTDQFLAAYNSSTNTTSKIAALQALPMAISRFKVTTDGPSIPVWLQSILTDGLNANDLKIIQATVDQIGINGILSYSGKLATLYGQNAGNVDLRISIVKAMGSLATSDVIVFLGQVVDAHVLCQETDMAIAMIGRLCSTDLVPKISSYVNNIQTRMQNGEFTFSVNNVQIVQQDPNSSVSTSQTNTATANNTKPKPLVSPENSLNLALSAIKMMGNGTCGK